jgi:TRAP-type C4-dicarboxylate transport system substrate-binding protein
MLVSEHFWNNISEEVKAVIKHAAIEAGRSERRETIEDGEQARQQLINDGATVVDLSEEDALLFRQKTQAVYEQFADFFEPGLIYTIRRLHSGCYDQRNSPAKPTLGSP